MPDRYSARPLPPYRYLPGQSPHPTRDPRGHSAGAADERPQPLDPDAWRTSDDYLYGVDLLNHGYWWEAHEAFEGLWREAGRDTEIGGFLQGLIQIAGALLKSATGPPAAARGLARVGSARLRELPGVFLGVDCAALTSSVDDYLAGRRSAPPRIRLVRDA